MVEYKGFFRIHFNRKDEFPRVVSLSAHDQAWEILAQSLRIEPGVEPVDGYNPDAKSGLEPCWWLGCRAQLAVDWNGNARIQPFDEKK